MQLALDWLQKVESFAAGLCLPPPGPQVGQNIKWEEMFSAGVAAANT